MRSTTSQTQRLDPAPYNATARQSFKAAWDTFQAIHEQDRAAREAFQTARGSFRTVYGQWGPPHAAGNAVKDDDAFIRNVYRDAALYWFVVEVEALAYIVPNLPDYRVWFETWAAARDLRNSIVHLPLPLHSSRDEMLIRASAVQDPMNRIISNIEVATAATTRARSAGVAAGAVGIPEARAGAAAGAATEAKATASGAGAAGAEPHPALGIALDALTGFLDAYNAYTVNEGRAAIRRDVYRDAALYRYVLLWESIKELDTKPNRCIALILPRLVRNKIAHLWRASNDETMQVLQDQMNGILSSVKDILGGLTIRFELNADGRRALSILESLTGHGTGASVGMRLLTKPRFPQLLDPAAHAGAMAAAAGMGTVSAGTVAAAAGATAGRARAFAPAPAVAEARSLAGTPRAQAAVAGGAVATGAVAAAAAGSAEETETDRAARIAEDKTDRAAKKTAKAAAKMAKELEIKRKEKKKAERKAEAEARAAEEAEDLKARIDKNCIERLLTKVAKDINDASKTGALQARSVGYTTWNGIVKPEIIKYQQDPRPWFEKLYSKSHHLSDVFSGGNVLHFAAAIGDIDVIAYLVGQGKDPRVRGKNNLLPLHAAITHGNVDATRILLYLTPEQALDPYTLGAAACAAMDYGYIDIYRTILEAGVMRLSNRARTEVSLRSPARPFLQVAAAMVRRLDCGSKTGKGQLLLMAIDVLQKIILQSSTIEEYLIFLEDLCDAMEYVYEAVPLQERFNLFPTLNAKFRNLLGERFRAPSFEALVLAQESSKVKEGDGIVVGSGTHTSAVDAAGGADSSMENSSATAALPTPLPSGPTDHPQDDVLPELPPSEPTGHQQAEVSSVTQKQEQQQNQPQGNGRLLAPELAFTANQLSETVLPWISGHTGIPATIASAEALSPVQFLTRLAFLMASRSASRQTPTMQGSCQAEVYEFLIAAQDEEAPNHWVTIGCDEQGTWYSTDPENSEVANALTKRGVAVLTETSPEGITTLPVENACGVTGAVLVALRLSATPHVPFSWAVYDQITRGLLAVRLMPAVISPAAPALRRVVSTQTITALPEVPDQPLLKLEDPALCFQNWSEASAPTTESGPSNLDVEAFEGSGAMSNSSFNVSSVNASARNSSNNGDANASSAVWAHTSSSGLPAWIVGVIAHAQQAAAAGNHEAAGLALAGLGYMNGGLDGVIAVIDALAGGDADVAAAPSPAAEVPPLIDIVDVAVAMGIVPPPVSDLFLGAEHPAEVVKAADHPDQHAHEMAAVEIMGLL